MWKYRFDCRQSWVASSRLYLGSLGPPTSVKRCSLFSSPSSHGLALTFHVQHERSQFSSESLPPTMASRSTSLDAIESGRLDGNDDSSIFDEKCDKKDSKHSTPMLVNPRIISDATIGLSDGLTVPFALTAGLSALGDTSVVLYGGIAELIAGGISMGLGGYLGAKSEAEAYTSTLAATRSMVSFDRDRAADAVRLTFGEHGLSQDTLDRMVVDLLEDPTSLAKFLMRFHHNLAENDFTPSKAYISGLTISLGYILGGLVPLLPYVVLRDLHCAFVVSVVVMGFALFVFGWLKTSFLGEKRLSTCFKNGLQMVAFGGIAAAAAMGCVRAVGS